MTLTEQLTDYVHAAFTGLWIQTSEPDEAEREIVQHARAAQLEGRRLGRRRRPAPARRPPARAATTPAPATRWPPCAPCPPWPSATAPPCCCCTTSTAS